MDYSRPVPWHVLINPNRQICFKQCSSCSESREKLSEWLITHWTCARVWFHWGCLLYDTGQEPSAMCNVLMRLKKLHYRLLTCNILQYNTTMSWNKCKKQVLHALAAAIFWSKYAAVQFLVRAEVYTEWNLNGEWMIVHLFCDCIPMNSWALSKPVCLN